MSVLDEKVIDFAGIEKSERNLILTITDHLVWGQETDDVHILILQNKINDYLRFIESNEVTECFASKDYDKIKIRIISKYSFDSICLDFLDKAKRMVNEVGIGLEWEVSES